MGVSPVVFLLSDGFVRVDDPSSGYERWHRAPEDVLTVSWEEWNKWVPAHKESEGIDTELKMAGHLKSGKNRSDIGLREI